MATKAALEDLVRRQSDCIQQQSGSITALKREIEALKAEIGRLNERDVDALEVLQKVYSDPNAPLSAVVKAAGAAVGYERSKPPSVAISAGVSLYDVLERKRLERLQAKPAVIDAKPNPAA